VKEKIIFFSVLALSAVSAAQVATPEAEYRHARQVTITYMHTFDDFDSNHGYDFDGAKGEFEQYLSHHASMFGDFGGAANSQFSAHYLTYRGGARVRVGGIHEVRLFAGFALGGAHFNGPIGSPLVNTTYNGFTWAPQAGADIPLHHRWGIRVKYEYQSVPFGFSGRDFWHNAEGGVSYRW
jgi:hypothetical protein